MSGVANVKRRTFELDPAAPAAPAATARTEDLDVVETSFGKFKRADVGAQGPSGSDRAFLDVSAARAQLDIDARVGKFEKVEGGARKAGYECTLCDLVFHDSDALLDHLNSRLHQGKLGFSMKIAKSSVAEVKSRLAMHLEQAASEAATKREVRGDSLETRLKQAAEEAEARKRAKREAKQRRKKRGGDAEEEREGNNNNNGVEGDGGQEGEDAIAAELGFASFGKSA